MLEVLVVEAVPECWSVLLFVIQHELLSETFYAGDCELCPRRVPGLTTTIFNINKLGSKAKLRYLGVNTESEVHQAQTFLVHHQSHVLPVYAGLLLGDGLVDVEVGLVMPALELRQLISLLFLRHAGVVMAWWECHNLTITGKERKALGGGLLCCYCSVKSSSLTWPCLACDSADTGDFCLLSHNTKFSHIVSQSVSNIDVSHLFGLETLTAFRQKGLITIRWL